MQKIRVDFDNPGLPQHISAVENDSQSRFFQASLYENGKAYTAPEGATYSIMYRGFGPQNQGWYDTINDGAGKRAACAVSGNVVTCEIARQALQVPGHVSIVLCVTTGKGYMLKSWPIECDCKNDRYDSTAEIQSFFYVTQISNESWTQAIQAVEELKNTIDPTLSVSGKAADAAKVGEAVNAETERAKGVEGQLKEDLDKLEKLNLQYVDDGIRDESNYYCSMSALSTDRMYAFEITTSVSGKMTLQTGTSWSLSSMKDTLGTFDFVANTPVIIFGYTPSGKYGTARLSTANEWKLKIYEINEIVSLKEEISKTTRAILTASCKVGEELITASNTVVGDGWSGDNTNGFTHESGKNEPLTFNVNATNGYVYLIEFDCTNLTDNYLLVKMGNSYESQVYNGQEHISTAIQDVTNGGALKIIVSKSDFNGTIKNISCRRIYDDGIYEKTFDVDVISINDVQNNPTGFWNVVLTRSGFTSTVNSTRTICIGEHALSKLISGNRNIAIGTFALSQLLDGEKNIAIGADSMIYVQHGVSNISLGKGAMEYGNNVEHNIAIGENALKGSAVSDARYTIAIGSASGYYCDKSYNVFIGRNAGYNSRGIRNVTIGDSSYKTNVYGHENTCIGAESDTNDGVVNSIAIGFGAKATKDNQCVIGNASMSEFIFGEKKITFNIDHTVTWEDVS